MKQISEMSDLSARKKRESREMDQDSEEGVWLRYEEHRDGKGTAMRIEEQK